MARVTVEDCVKKIPNRFDLCLLSSHRAEDILTGATTEIGNKKEKVAVTALREIGDGLVDVDVLKDNFVDSLTDKGSQDYDEIIVENVIESPSNMEGEGATEEYGDEYEESEEESDEESDEDYEDSEDEE